MQGLQRLQQALSNTITIHVFFEDGLFVQFSFNKTVKNKRFKCNIFGVNRRNALDVKNVSYLMLQCG